MQQMPIAPFVYLPVALFVYGMSFLVLSLTIGIEQVGPGKGFGRFLFSSLGFLAIFGLTHGIVELIDLFALLNGGIFLFLRVFRLFLLSASFFFLLKFGIAFAERGGSAGEAGISSGFSRRLRFVRQNILPVFAWGIWFLLVLFLYTQGGFGNSWFVRGEILQRYFLCLPAAIITAVSFLKNRGKESAFSNTFRIIIFLGFLFYGVFCGLIVPRAEFYPASFLNYPWFRSTTGVPVQVFRTMSALLIAIGILGFLRSDRKFPSIRSKAVFNAFISVAIPSFAVIALVSILIAGALIRLSFRENGKLASLAAARMTSFLREAEEKVRDEMTMFQLSSTGNEKDLLTAFLVENDDINGIAVIDRRGDPDGKGKEILSAEEDPSSRKVNYVKWAPGVRLGELLKNSPFMNSDDNLYTMRHDGDAAVMVIPVSNGTINVSVDLKHLYSSILDIREAKRWSAVLHDERDKPVLPPATGKVSEKQVSAGEDIITDINGQPIIEEGRHYDTVRVKIPPTAWSVAVEIPRSETIMPVFRVFKILLFGLLGVYLSAVLLALVFVEKVARPINLISHRVNLIGKGDFDSGEKLDIKSGDELQFLSEEVEKMARQLAEMKKIEERMAQTQKIASVGRLTAGVAHEINNPLGIILGYSQVLLRQMKADDPFYADVKTIEKHALASKKIMEDFLKFSRSYEHVNVKVDLNENIRESLALIPAPFTRDKITVTTQLDDGLPDIIGDPDKLHQLFLNLIMNAFDAMEKGGSLLIRTGRVPPDTTGEIEVLFQDTGSGIKPEDIKNVFDPFFTTKAVGKGTGLGLSVSYGIVKDHNGKIWAESEPGKGTTFHIVFPTAKGSEETDLKG